MGLLSDVFGGRKMVESTSGQAAPTKPQLQLTGKEIKYTANDRENDFRTNRGGYGGFRTDDGYKMGLNQPFADLVVVESYDYVRGEYCATNNWHIWIGDNELAADVIETYMQNRRAIDKRVLGRTDVEYRFVGGLENYYDAETGKPLEDM